MGDIGELWSDHKEQRQNKKRDNIKQSTEILKENGIKFESKNNGVHLVVIGLDCYIDFWPSTGKWIERCFIGREGRGVNKLIKLIRG